MKVLEKISLILSEIAKYLAVISTGTMWLVTCYAVFMRYILRNSPVWSDELCRYALVWLTFYGGSVALHSRSLANMNLLVNLIPPKPRKWFNIMVSILGLALLTAFTIWAIQLVSSRSVQIQKTPAMGIPLPVVYSCLPIGLGLMALQQLCLILHDIFTDPYELAGEITEVTEGDAV